MVDRNYIVYVHKDSEGSIRYVGHGRHYRAQQLFANSGRGKRYLKYVNENGNLNLEIIKENLTKQEASALEKELYFQYKSDFLLNANPPRSVSIKLSKEIIQCFTYSETSPSGLLWAVNCGGPVGKQFKIGQNAGSKNPRGYFEVRVNKVSYRVHRIIFQMHNPLIEMDGLVIDHIDGNPSNNLIGNLRIVTGAENSRNLNKPKRKDDLPTGVTFDGRYNLFIARVSDPSRRYDSGMAFLVQKYFKVKDFDSYDEALKAATDCRNFMLEELNSRLKLGYTDDHCT